MCSSWGYSPSFPSCSGTWNSVACLQAFCLDSLSYHCYSTGQMPWWMLGFSVRLQLSWEASQWFSVVWDTLKVILSFLLFFPTPGTCLRKWTLDSCSGIHHHVKWLVTSSLISPSQKVKLIFFFLLKNYLLSHSHYLHKHSLKFGSPVLKML